MTDYMRNFFRIKEKLAMDSKIRPLSEKELKEQKQELEQEKKKIEAKEKLIMLQKEVMQSHSLNAIGIFRLYFNIMSAIHDYIMEWHREGFYEYKKELLSRMSFSEEQYHYFLSRFVDHENSRDYDTHTRFAMLNHNEDVISNEFLPICKFLYYYKEVDIQKLIIDNHEEK